MARAHTGVQNGDVMHDPEIAAGVVVGVDFVVRPDVVVAERDQLGVERAELEHARRTGVYAKRRAELVSFARVWFRNLREQGFLGDTAARERIA